MQGILYTTLDCFSTGRGSFTLDSTKRSDRPDLKITCMPYFLRTCQMPTLTPALYGSITWSSLFPPLVVAPGVPPCVGRVAG